MPPMRTWSRFRKRLRTWRRGTGAFPSMNSTATFASGTTYRTHELNAADPHKLTPMPPILGRVTMLDGCDIVFQSAYVEWLTVVEPNRDRSIAATRELKESLRARRFKLPRFVDS